MGVIYKLKQEIIDYILEEKRGNPHLSCRSLTSLIKEKFQLDVSKSSINAVIKNAQLSSPIGRRIDVSKTKKFKIPEEKKAQLFTETPLLLTNGPSDPSKIPQIKPEFVVEKTTPADDMKPKLEEVPSVSGEKTTSVQTNEIKEELPMAKEPAPEPVIELPAAEPPQAQEIEEVARIEEPTLSIEEQKEPSEIEITPVAQKSDKDSETIKEDETAEAEEIPPTEPEERPHLMPDPLALGASDAKQELTEEPKEEPKEEPAPTEPVKEEPLKAEPPEQDFPTQEEISVSETTDITGTEELIEVPPDEPIPLSETVETPKDEKANDEKPPLETPSKESPQKDSAQIYEPHLKEVPLSARPYSDDKIWTPGSEQFARTHAASTPAVPEEEAPLDAMGAVFLKAAEWELSNSSILGGLLRKHLNTNLPIDINDVSEALLYFEVFGIKKLEDIKGYDKKGLWELNGIKQKLNFEAIQKIVDGIHNLKSLTIAMANEYAQLFSEVSYIRISFQDNSDVCFDAQLKSIWFESGIRPIFTVPLNKALGCLSANFISNTQPAIILGVPGYKSFSTQFYQMVSVFENAPSKIIAKIGIFDGRKGEIAKFSIVPAKKRFFVIGAWPWQDECKKFIEEDVRVIKNFFHKALQKEIYYSELKAKLAQETIGQNINVRVALLRESGLDWPFMAVVTNIPEDKMATEDMISLYLTRWPNAQEGHNDFAAKVEKASYGAVSVTPAHDRVPLLEGGGQYNLLSGSPDLWTNIRFLLSSLNNYCQRHFFPPHYEKLDFSAIRERIYALPGYIRQDSETITVQLKLNEDYAHRKDLEYAIRRLKESNIRDYSGKKLQLSIK